jgi:hypothetical protein
MGEEAELKLWEPTRLKLCSLMRVRIVCAVCVQLVHELKGFSVAVSAALGLTLVVGAEGLLCVCVCVCVLN